jgi:uncharacterized protein YbjT (DUF2867 family)
MMNRPSILLCGGTGELGGAVARHLHARGVPFRALVRPATDPGPLATLATVIVRADLREPAGLPAAVEGVTTVVSTANSIGRLLGGARDMSIRDVDDRGYANLIAAAERAGVERFVYVSMLGDFGEAHTPFTDAKIATERRLRASKLREVIVRPDMFQEVWLGAAGGFDLAGGRATIYGQGRARHRHVAIDDVAEATVRLALAGDPPREVGLAGPDAVSALEALEAFEGMLGHPLRARHVPRIALRVGRVVLRPIKPEIASIMGMALAGDREDTSIGDEGFTALGIEPRGARTYIAQTTGVPA